MIKYQFFAAAASLFLLSTPSNAWDIDKMNQQIDETNAIVSEICSGTIIDTEKRLVLTAHHCITDNIKTVEKKEVNQQTGEVKTKTVEEKQPMFIETWSRGKSYDVVTKEIHTASIYGYDQDADVAILQVDDEGWKPKMSAPFASDSFEYKRGKPVFAVGNPGILFDNSVTTGIISAPARLLEIGSGSKIPFFQMSANIIGGNSGGAVYNDSGELIGTVSAGVRGSDIGLAVPISKTKELLKKLSPSSSSSKPN